jgi:glycosyltransferase involved in cell wall biosynthesis
VRILQVLPARPSEYDKKSQRIDYELLRHDYDVSLVQAVHAEVVLAYGRPPVSELPEAVEESYFRGGQPPSAVLHSGGPLSSTIGSFRRKSIVSIVEQTMARIHRTRDDIEWLLLDAPPRDFSEFDLWVDPAIDENDRDGFVAEALVSGKSVVASRTEINHKRLEKGRTGFLVPPRDSNELTHAILAALFKSEVAQQKIDAARQTMSKFHPRQRYRALRLLLP